MQYVIDDCSLTAAWRWSPFIQ